MTWQPIETAPKDRTPILATYAPDGDYYLSGLHPCPVVCVFWGTYHPNAAGKPSWRDGNGHHRPYLTHWMPLPTPPAVPR